MKKIWKIFALGAVASMAVCSAFAAGGITHAPGHMLITDIPESFLQN